MPVLAIALLPGAPHAALLRHPPRVLQLVHLGALRLERRDKVQGVAIRSWVEQLLDQFDGRILPLDSGVALRTAELHVPDPKSDHDAIIAATGLVHGMTVVTRNVRDFQDTSVELLDPWTSATLGG